MREWFFAYGLSKKFEEFIAMTPDRGAALSAARKALNTFRQTVVYMRREKPTGGFFEETVQTFSRPITDERHGGRRAYGWR